MTMRLTRPEGTPAADLAVSRRGLGGLMFMGYAAAALGARAQPVITPDDGLVVDRIEFPAPDGFALPAYVARPAGEGPFPVVLVASEIFGLHAYIQDVCRRLARQGYAAMAPGYFLRAGDPAPLSDFAEIMPIVAAAGHDQVMGDTGAALAWLDAQPWADVSRAGITGFCWGGTVVWMACAAHDFGAGAAWYGRLVAPAQGGEPGRPWPVDVAGQLRCPVLGLYAENDRGIPLDSVEAMRAALAAAGRDDCEIVFYPGTEHGFHADYRPSYAAAAAADGWARMSALFAENLGGAPAAP